MFTKLFFNSVKKCEYSTEYPKRDQEKLKFALEGRLYSQVVIIRRQTMKEKQKDRSSVTKTKYLFQGPSAISQY